tara:strand:+ start:31907 stop:32518 length:612 start_codon:yes stop_codon:yes gene_type:complete
VIGKGGLFIKNDAYGEWFGKEPMSFLSSRNEANPDQSRNGIAFLLPPEINISAQADYTSNDLVHTNHNIYSWKRSAVNDISVVLPFVNNTKHKAHYFIGAIQFCRTVTKGFIGKSQGAGAPPPILEFSSNGDFIYNKVPVVMKNFVVPINNQDSDYVDTEYGRVQVKATINITLSPVYPANESLTDFDIEQYATGQNAIKGFY